MKQEQCERSRTSRDVSVRQSKKSDGFDGRTKLCNRGLGCVGQHKLDVLDQQNILDLPVVLYF